MTYLGVPFGGNTKSLSFWNPVEEKILAQLTKWSNFVCSRGGMLTLARVVLSNIPIYFLPIFHCPDKVLKNLEKMI